MKQNEIFAFLKTLPLFQNTDDTLLEGTLNGPHCRIQQVKNGERIGSDDAHELVILLKGYAKIRSTDGERSVILRTPGPGDVLGAAALFLPQAMPLSRIQAVGEATALLMRDTAVRQLMAKDAAFLDAYLAFLAQKVHFLNQKIRCFTAGSAERRLALWLYGEGSEQILLPVSVSALADTLDIGRASLYRALDKLEADGLITRDGRMIQVISRDTILRKYQ